MRNKRKKWVQHMVAFVLVIAMLLPMATPVSAEAAENDLYLAYQNTEYGESVVALKNSWERERYKVTELYLDIGDKADLCFINASNWKNAQWKSSNTDVVKVDSNGVLTAVAEGTTTITLTYTKRISIGKKTVSASITVYVGEKNLDLYVGTGWMSFELNEYNVKVGSELELDCFSENGRTNYDQYFSTYARQPWIDIDVFSSNESVVEVFGQTVHARKAGTAIVTAEIKNIVLNTKISKTIKVNVTSPVYIESEKWDNKYYQMYGENYIKMFSNSKYLYTTNNVEYNLIDDAWHMLNGRLTSIGISAFAELADIENGLSIAFEGLLNGKKYRQDELHREAVLYLIEEITTDESFDKKYITNVKGALEKSKGLFTELDNANKLSDIIEKIEKAGLDIPKTEQKTIANYVLNDAAGDIKKVLSEGVTITEYLALTLCLYELDCKLLDDLQMCSKEGEALYDDIQLIREEKEKNPETYFSEKYCNDAFIRIAVKTITKLAGKEAMNLLSVTGDFIVMWIELAGVNKLSELTKATYLMQYAACMKGRLDELRIDIPKNYTSYSESGLREKIDEYETVYRLYLSTCDVVLSAISELNQECYEVLYDDHRLVMNNAYFDSHVATAMAWYMHENPSADERESVKNDVDSTATQTTVMPTPSVSNDDSNVKEKMDQLYKLLGKKYCTVNQKACKTFRESGHMCDNCNMRDIVQAKWFKNSFRTVNVDNFPEHDVDASRRDHTGQSCFGFACFAQWYVYADSNTDKVTAERITSVTFNKANMEKYVQPGDVVRVNGHSVLVYSIEKDGLMVIDSNWNSGGQLNCLVQKHLLSYSNENYAGYTAYINRVMESGKETNSSTTIVETKNKTQYGYYHYTNGAGEYAVCAYHGVDVNGWKNVYREEIWVDEPLSTVASEYRHVRQSGCDEIGCVDSEWKNGNKYIDSNGVVWYRQKTKTVEHNAKETKNHTVIGEGIGVATATPVPTSTPVPTTTPIPEPVVSDWVKASECPVGATVVDTKWTYTYTERTESTSAVMDGWIRDGERKEVVASGTFDYATFPDTFDTSNAVYNSMYTSKNAIPVAEGAIREILSDSPMGYVYWHYAYPVGGGGDAGNRIVGYYYNQNLKYVGNWCYATEFCAFKSTKNYTTTADNKEGGGTVYKITDSDYVKYDVAKGSHWWYRFEYNTCTYQDVKKIYQYYRTSNQEATSEVYEGNGNSNVVKWIRYK